LTKCTKTNSYKWPHPKDCAEVEDKFVQGVQPEVITSSDNSFDIVNIESIEKTSMIIVKCLTLAIRLT